MAIDLQAEEHISHMRDALPCLKQGLGSTSKMENFTIYLSEDNTLLKTVNVVIMNDVLVHEYSFGASLLPFMTLATIVNIIKDNQSVQLKIYNKYIRNATLYTVGSTDKPIDKLNDMILNYQYKPFNITRNNSRHFVIILFGLLASIGIDIDSQFILNHLSKDQKLPRLYALVSCLLRTTLVTHIPITIAGIPLNSEYFFDLVTSMKLNLVVKTNSKQYYEKLYTKTLGLKDFIELLNK